MPRKSAYECSEPVLFPRGIKVDWVINHSLSGGG